MNRQADGDPFPLLLLTESQAARSLRISPRTLWGLRQSGQIPCVREGRMVRYDPVDLRDWIDRKKSCQIAQVNLQHQLAPKLAERETGSVPGTA